MSEDSKSDKKSGCCGCLGCVFVILLLLGGCLILISSDEGTAEGNTPEAKVIATELKRDITLGLQMKGLDDLKVKNVFLGKKSSETEYTGYVEYAYRGETEKVAAAAISENGHLKKYNSNLPITLLIKMDSNH